MSVSLLLLGLMIEYRVYNQRPLLNAESLQILQGPRCLQPHRFAVGFRSGDWDVYSVVTEPFGCLTPVSCWRIQPLPTPKDFHLKSHDTSQNV